MAIQFAPVAGIALRYGGMALATYAATRMLRQGRRDPRAEQVLDDLPMGLRLRNSENQVNASGRWSWSYRFFRGGPGLKLDAAALARLRLTRI